jgi:hypothetical protein
VLGVENDEDDEDVDGVGLLRSDEVLLEVEVEVEVV